ncbi:MAG TPA: hypothetical protein PLZ51_20120, partial [Aggregatilineales bacterium]|nr:hypothetical protein [Aggregatilineales bacterium]
NVASININESVLRDAIKAAVMAAIENAINASSASFVGPYIIHYQYNETTNQITPILSLALRPSFRGVTFFSAIDFTGDNE